jgi:hypothetical protein
LVTEVEERSGEELRRAGRRGCTQLRKYHPQVDILLAN